MQNVAVPWLRQRFDLAFEMPDMQQVVTLLQDHWKEAGGVATTIVAGVSKSGFAVISWITRLVVIPVAFFYLLRDWDVMIAKIHDLLPRSIEPVVSRLAREADETLSAGATGCEAARAGISVEVPSARATKTKECGGACFM